MEIQTQKTAQNQSKKAASPSVKALPEQKAGGGAAKNTGSLKFTGFSLQKIQQDTYESPLLPHLQTGNFTPSSPAAQNTYTNSIKTAKLQTAAAEGLSFTGELSKENLLEIKENLPEDEIDWGWMALKMNRSVTPGNADTLTREVDSMVSAYVAAKNHLEQVYAEHEELRKESLEKLENMFSHGKQQLTRSYEQNIGSFYERLGNAGVKNDMGNSLSSAIDRRVQEMETKLKESKMMEKEGFNSVAIVELSLQTESILAMENGQPTASSLEKGEEKYSLNDLQAAGAVAKAALSMNPRELHFMRDDELGIHLAVRMMKMEELLSHLGIDKDMTDFLQDSFASYLNHYSGNALSDKNRAFNAYHGTLKQYEKCGDIKQALTAGAKKYLGDSFFNSFQKDKNNIGTSKSTRYNFELAQFVSASAKGDVTAMIQSIAGNKVYTLSTYA